MTDLTYYILFAYPLFDSLICLGVSMSATEQEVACLIPSTSTLLNVD